MYRNTRNINNLLFDVPYIGIICAKYKNKKIVCLYIIKNTDNISGV